jgi:DNA-binding response OmpR family regulator
MDSELINVVLIEDDPDYAELYRLRLQQDGHRVLVATDGEAGLELVRGTMPDLVYLDWRMPKLDGFDVLSALRSDPNTAHLPVIVLSNYNEPELRQHGVELGVLQWVVKADITPSLLAQQTAALFASFEGERGVDGSG